MIGAYVSLLLVLAAALLLGQALAAFAGGATIASARLAVSLARARLRDRGPARRSAGSPIRLPGHAATAAAVVLASLTVLAAGYLWRRASAAVGTAAAVGIPGRRRSRCSPPSLPFAIAGFVGILGVGLSTTTWRRT